MVTNFMRMKFIFLYAIPDAVFQKKIKHVFSNALLNLMILFKEQDLAYQSVKVSLRK